MLDRRKLAVPLVAQAGAFVVVLVIGGFTGHPQPKAPSGTAVTASPGGTGSPGTVSPGPGRGPAVKLSVKVTEGGTGLSVPGRQVRVLRSGTLASVASGTLDSSQGYAANVSAGQYEVCVDPPIGWRSQTRGTEVLAGWICSAADLGKGPQLVTFHLVPQIPSAGQ